MFGKKQTEATKALISAANKGEKSSNFGKRGEEAARYRGGKKVSNTRNHAKRHRNLGFIPLNTYFAGCEGHHINVREVIFIPKEMHKSVWHNLNTGQGMKAINALALNFLVNGF